MLNEKMTMIGSDVERLKELFKRERPKKTWWDCVKNDMES